MIQGDKIYLRPLQFDDWTMTLKWRNDLEFRNLIMSHPFPVTEFLEKEWIQHIISDKNNKNIYFGICCKENDVLVGIVNLHQIDWISRNAFFGIYLGDRSTRGKGFGKEATNLMLSFAFSVLNLRKVNLYVLSNNSPAINIYKKLNFKTEGTLSQHWFSSNKYIDVLLMAKFKENN